MVNHLMVSSWQVSKILCSSKLGLSRCGSKNIFTPLLSYDIGSVYWDKKQFRDGCFRGFITNVCSGDRGRGNNIVSVSSSGSGINTENFLVLNQKRDLRTHQHPGTMNCFALRNIGNSSTSCDSRWLSTSNGGGGTNGNDDNKNDKKGKGFDSDSFLRNTSYDDNDDDPFGVDYDDGDDIGKLGPEDDFPPEYKRDETTGKILKNQPDNVKSVIIMSEEERELIQADPKQRNEIMFRKIVQNWDNQSDLVDESSGQSLTLAEFARKVRFADMGLNVLGRSTKAVVYDKNNDDDHREVENENRTQNQHKQQLSKPLSHEEFEVFKSFMEKEYGTKILEDDIPVRDPSTNYEPYQATQMNNEEINETNVGDGGENYSDKYEDADNPDLSLKWMTKRAKWEMSQTEFPKYKTQDDNPFGDMLPSELRPTRIVNRKRAKPLSVSLLSPNNLSLLKRYMTPNGQIMSRIQTRLGARDQRRIARLVKRARNLGLIPTQGQFIIHDNGNVHEEDIQGNKWWEDELIKRGLVIDEDAINKDEINPIKEEIKKYRDPNWLKNELKKRGR